MTGYVGPIEALTVTNTYFRQVLFTAKHAQLVVMCLQPGDAIVIPAGTYHNVINTSETTPLRLYTVYSPPNHPDGAVHKTKAESEAAEPVRLRA